MNIPFTELLAMRNYAETKLRWHERSQEKEPKPSKVHTEGIQTWEARLNSIREEMDRRFNDMKS